MKKSPLYIYERLPVEYDRETRLSVSNSLRIALTKRVTLRLSEKSFMHRAVISYNRIPVELRQMKNIDTFKAKLKMWVQKNIDVQ